MGDDPKTMKTFGGNMTSEEQHLTCAATNGTFRLSFRGEVTDPLPHDISAKVGWFVPRVLAE